MRYLILRPATSGSCILDPERLPAFDDFDELHTAFPVEVECFEEHEASRLVRLTFPNAITMPIPVKVGSGMTFILGVLESIAVMPSSEGAKIPFVMFVQAVSDNVDERRRIHNQKAKVYSRTLWRIPVTSVIDEYIGVLQGEVRTSALEQPIPVEFSVSVTEDDRIMLTGKMLGTETITLLLPRVTTANVIRACEAPQREESGAEHAVHGDGRAKAGTLAGPEVFRTGDGGQG